MKENILLSVVIPLYKAEPYIEKCLQSVLTQSYSNLEIIVVNDGSPDNSTDIVRTYQKKDARIKLFDKKNEGAAIARNVGIAACSGEYIHFLDSDDYVEPSAYEKMIAKALEDNADIVRGSAIKRYFGFENDRQDELLPAKWNEPFCKIQFFWSCIFRRSLITDNNITIPSYKIFEDICFNYEVQTHADTISYIDDIVYAWCQYNSPFNGHKYDDWKTQLDKAKSIRYLLEVMLKSDKAELDSAVIGAVDHFIHFNYSSHLRMPVDVLKEYTVELNAIVMLSERSEYRVPGLYNTMLKRIRDNAYRQCRIIKNDFRLIRWVYMGLYYLKEKNIFPVIGKNIKLL